MPNQQEQRIVAKISEVDWLSAIVEAGLAEDLLQVLAVLLDHFVHELVGAGGLEVDAAAGGLGTVLGLPFGVVVGFDVLELLLDLHRVAPYFAILFLRRLEG
jgi:hypothetical protein